MLDGYGIHTLIWDSADERLGDFLVASPADAEGRAKRWRQLYAFLERHGLVCDQRIRDELG